MVDLLNRLVNTGYRILPHVSHKISLGCLLDSRTDRWYELDVQAMWEGVSSKTPPASTSPHTVPHLGTRKEQGQQFQRNNWYSMLLFVSSCLFVSVMVMGCNVPPSYKTMLIFMYRKFQSCNDLLLSYDDMLVFVLTLPETFSHLSTVPSIRPRSKVHSDNDTLRIPNYGDAASLKIADGSASEDEKYSTKRWNFDSHSELLCIFVLDVLYHLHGRNIRDCTGKYMCCLFDLYCVNSTLDAGVFSPRLPCIQNIQIWL